jgi:hypothetical protein
MAASGGDPARATLIGPHGRFSWRDDLPRALAPEDKIV